MKKIFVMLAALVGFLLVAALCIPFFVDVDKYRPQITQAANEHLNGKLELGKLSLSLWGQVHVRVDGLKLSDASGRSVVSVKDAYFHLPFLSLLDGSPSLILSMEQPELHIVKQKDGKLNAMTLPKGAPGAQAPSGAGSAAAPGATASSQPTSLPAIATRARLGIEIKNAALTYKDETSGISSNISNLNVVMHDISLSHEMSLEVSANLDTESKASGKSGGMVVKGPAKLSATANPNVIGGKFESVAVTAHVSLDDLEIEMPGVFHKAKGVDAHADVKLTASPDSADFRALSIKFFNAQIEGKGGVSHISSQAGPPVADFSMKSNTIDLKSWSELIPPLKQYELGGTADFSASAKGPSDKLSYQALLEVKNLTAKAGNLKAQPTFNVTVSVVTDQIDKLLLTMKAPGNDLTVSGKLVGFNAPHVSLNVASTGMDLDQLVDFKPLPGKGEAGSAEAKAGPNSGPGSQPVDLDAELEPLRENKMLQSLVAAIAVDMKSIQARGVKITNLESKMSMHDLIVAIDSFSMGVFSGTIKSSLSMNLRPKLPTYKLSAAIAGLDLQQAVASQYQMFKNTIVGKASFDMNGEGASFNTPAAMGNLNAKGKLRVTNATLSTVDVSKMASDGLNSGLSKVSGKIPGLGGKAASGASGESKYDLISTDFTIAGGKFNAPNFVAKATPNQGIDLKGDAAVGLKDQTVRANLMVTDTYNMTHARDIGNHILADGNAPVQFPISVGCTLSAPCYSYAAVAEYLLKIAVKNSLGNAKKSLLQGVLKQQGSGSGGNPAVSNAIQSLGKKLFGN